MHIYQWDCSEPALSVVIIIFLNKSMLPKKHLSNRLMPVVQMGEHFSQTYFTLHNLTTHLNTFHAHHTTCVSVWPLVMSVYEVSMLIF